MALIDDIITFVQQCQLRISELNEELVVLDKKAKHSSTRYKNALCLIQKLILVSESLFCPYYYIVDEDGDHTPYPQHLTASQIRTMMEYWKFYAGMGILPFNVDLMTTSYIVVGSESSGTGLPYGGLPGWILTKDSENSPIWEARPDYITGPNMS